jgi:hypothetical protein
MGFGHIKRRKDDVLYSTYLRKKRDYTCERCKRIFPEGKGLEISHYYGRRKESVRFDEANTDVCCTGCHRYFGENPGEYYAYKFKQLGETRYNLLILRANQTIKKNIEANIREIKLRIKEDAETRKTGQA